jgi:hypothetical protein
VIVSGLIATTRIEGKAGDDHWRRSAQVQATFEVQSHSSVNVVDPDEMWAN